MNHNIINKIFNYNYLNMWKNKLKYLHDELINKITNGELTNDKDEICFRRNSCKYCTTSILANFYFVNYRGYKKIQIYNYFMCVYCNIKNKILVSKNY